MTPEAPIVVATFGSLVRQGYPVSTAVNSLARDERVLIERIASAAT